MKKTISFFRNPNTLNHPIISSDPIVKTISEILVSAKTDTVAFSHERTSQRLAKLALELAFKNNKKVLNVRPCSDDLQNEIANLGCLTNSILVISSPHQINRVITELVDPRAHKNPRSSKEAPCKLSYIYDLNPIEPTTQAIIMSSRIPHWNDVRAMKASSRKLHPNLFTISHWIKSRPEL